MAAAGAGRPPRPQGGRVLVVGSINVDLYQKMQPSSIQLGEKAVDVTPVKGMTLPSKSFLEHEGIAAQGLKASPGEEEALVMTMKGPFEQKTGGKGANAAAAAAQTLACELFCNFGQASAEANKELLADLKAYGNVDTSRCSLVPGPTGTAYILLFGDRDNAIVLLAGGNAQWDKSKPVSAALHTAIATCCAVMLQREIPDFVNVAVAKAAHTLGKPVVMDMGGTDAPLDPELIPYLSVVAPNETELTFISGVDTNEDSQVSLPMVHKAVAAFKDRAREAGNASVEVLVTLGGLGSIHFASDWAPSAQAGETRMGHFRLTTADGRPKDTTGAGDCFRGSFVAARYGESRSVEEAMQWAAAAGALSVEVEGAMPSMPTRAAIEAAIQERTFDSFTYGYQEHEANSPKHQKDRSSGGGLAMWLPCCVSRAAA